jgi:hypothetical protein
MGACLLTIPLKIFKKEGSSIFDRGDQADSIPFYRNPPRMMEATVFFGSFNGADILVPFPRSVPRHNPVSELYGQFLQPHGLVFALTCTVNCGTLYRQVCVFSNQLNLPQVDSSQVVETSQRRSMETRVPRSRLLHFNLEKIKDQNLKTDCNLTSGILT